MVRGSIDVAFWSNLTAIVLIAILCLAGACSAYGVWSVIRRLFDAAGEQLEERDTTLIPPALTLIGAVATAVAERAADAFAEPIAIVLILGLTVNTWFGAWLADAAAVGRRSAAAGSLGYALLVWPLLALAAIGLSSGGELVREADKLTAQKTVSLVFGLGAMVLSVIAAVVLTRARRVRRSVR
jgi:hypothetical protein